ncbi:MAG: AraC family transcriptional regulator [Caldilineaceae bacterium]
MKQQKVSAIPPYLNSGYLDKGVSKDEDRSHSSVQIDSHINLPGSVELAPSAHHRLLIHTGTVTFVACRTHQMIYTRGDIDFFPAGLADVWTVDAVSATMLLQLPLAFFQAAAEAIGRDATRIELDTRCHFRDPQLEHIAWALDAERRAGYPSGRLYTDSLGMALAVHLLRGEREPVRVLPGLSKDELRRVTTYIAENLDEDLSLAVLAAVVDRSVSHFKTLFKRSTGLPVHEYVIQQRVKRAKDLLLHSKLPASQIARQVGFADQSHMARLMRRVLGVTPTSLIHNTLNT